MTNSLIEMLARGGEEVLSSVDAKVRIKRAPIDGRSFQVPLSALSGFHVRRRPKRRSLIGPPAIQSLPMCYGYISCADLPGERPWPHFHSCQHGPPPHRILVVMTRKGSNADAYEAAATVAGMKEWGESLTGSSSDDD